MVILLGWSFHHWNYVCVEVECCCFDFLVFVTYVGVCLVFKFFSSSFMRSQWARNFKKVQAKKLVQSNFFSWNCIFGSFKLFPSSKIDFWPFLKLQKNEIWPKIFSWNWFLWFHEFFLPGLFKIFWPAPRQTCGAFWNLKKKFPYHLFTFVSIHIGHPILGISRRVPIIVVRYIIPSYRNFFI